ncbi:MAG TPA: pyridoxal 5'-phosphate synthase glutaminase subunit PdxT [Candidatus Krumholzibacteria bacterium]|nr:pyridoxal 5'-phosphate synthase glutaminase subunit PdxT [Candidatus Krumholzibacteria bacterium]
MTRPARIGVLALQGDFAAHLQVLKEMGVEATTVRRPQELAGLSGLIIPGGESTTLIKLLRANDLISAIREFAKERGVMGTCAGAILMAKELEDAGGVEPLGLLDMTVRRNGFGRQIDSFEDEITTTVDFEGPAPRGGIFIRAPRILRVGEGVEVIAVYRQEPVAVRSRTTAPRHLALTFHPELNGVSSWHRLWLASIVAKRETASESPLH